MKSYWLALSMLMLLLLSGCSKENELKKSVYVPDSETPELPAYSEWGYNTFGAFYDRQVFRSSDDLVPVKVFSTDTAMQLILEGEIWHDSYSGGKGDMSLTFILSGFTPATYEDLVLLNDSVVDLKDPRCSVRVAGDFIVQPVIILSGILYFKRVQNLSVDKQHIEAILSGYFELRAMINNIPVTISEGRFDVGIGSNNFYLSN
jgi:hypothetical protein